MPNYTCVEPANENVNDKRVVAVTANDRITFPAVNSCFAIGVVLSDGRLLGGHVPMFWDTPSTTVAMSLMMKGENGESHQMQASITRIVSEINGHRNGTAVSAVITLGDAEWVPLWDALQGQLGYPKELRYQKNGGTGNLIIDGPTSACSVELRNHGGGGYMPLPAANRNVGAAARPATRVRI